FDFVSVNESRHCPIDTCIIFSGQNRQVAYLHSRSILHGDIKLLNAVLDAECRCVKVIDFGSSRILRSPATS
ncbi:unnamed protein product, partial [Sphacelaria rigidula]